VRGGFLPVVEMAEGSLVEMTGREVGDMTEWRGQNTKRDVHKEIGEYCHHGFFMEPRSPLVSFLQPLFHLPLNLDMYI
jgi:hypothetical protein